MHQSPLLTRDAEGLFWMARYLERVENLARLIDVTQTFESPGRETESWSALVAINSDGPGLAERGMAIEAGAVKRFYLLDAGNPNSIPACLEAARTNARKLRPLISTEMWMQLNVFHRTVMAIDPSELDGDALSRLCRRIKEGVQAHTGITEGTFFRDQGWHFYMIGRYLERADQTTRLLDTRFDALVPHAESGDADIEAGHWNALLRAAAGYHAYRREHPNGYNPQEVACFMLANTAFPRSAGLNLAQVEWHLTQLRARYFLSMSPALERLDHLNGLMTYHNVAEAAHNLSPFLDYLQQQIGGLHQDIVQTFAP